MEREVHSPRSHSLAVCGVPYRTSSLPRVQLQPRRSHSQDSPLINHPISLCIHIHIYHDFLKQTKGKTIEALLIKSHQQQPFMLARPSRVHLSSGHGPLFLCSHPAHPAHTAQGALQLHVSLLPHLGVLGTRQPWRCGTWHEASRHSMALALCPCPLPLRSTRPHSLQCLHSRQCSLGCGSWRGEAEKPTDTHLNKIF